jgi:hypothetical protein
LKYRHYINTPRAKPAEAGSLALRKKLGSTTAFLVGQIFSHTWQKLPGPQADKQGTSQHEENKPMVRFVL